MTPARNEGPVGIAAERLAGFPYALREAGLAVDPARAIAFLSAVRVARLDSIDDLRRAGRVTLTGQREDIPMFDAVFDVWFGGRPGTATAAPSDDEEEAPRSDRQAVGAALIEFTDGDTSGKAAVDDAARARKSFGRPTEADRAALLRMARLVDRLPSLKARSWRPSPRGVRIDLAQTARAARRTFGETLTLLRKDRPSRPRKLLILIDVSGSMKAQSEASLRLAHLLTAQRQKVETFCFGTSLSRVTATLRRRNADGALAHLADLVFDFDGGTMIGPSLEAFLAVSRHAALVRGAVTIVVSDGLERGSPTAMAHAVERLARLSHRLVWATPLAADPRYRPVTRAMAAILPSLDALVDGSGYPAFESLLEKLEAIERLPRRSAWRRFSAAGHRQPGSQP